MRRPLTAVALALALSACSAHFPWLPQKSTSAAPAAAPAAAGTDAAPAAAAPPATEQPVPVMSVDEIADAYVRLVLAFDVLDPGYVDAYYGPPAWRDVARKSGIDAAQIQHQAQQLMAALSKAHAETVAADPQLPDLRLRFLKNQLGSLSARAAMLRGQKFAFDDEARALYDVEPPPYDDAANSAALARVGAALPKGPGSLEQRYNRYVGRFIVPRARLDRVMHAALADARAKAAQHLALPAGEQFSVALVGGKSWSAYNWYQGQYLSRMELNADQAVSIDRAIRLAAHEGYPGHHLYGALLEKDLVRGHGWAEYQVTARYSPQAFVAEGSADFGVELSYPGEQRRLLEQALFRLAGFDTAKVNEYDRVVSAARQLAPANIEAARHYLDGEWTAAQTVDWLQEHALASPQAARLQVAFFDQYRSYIVNYSCGEEAVRHYVQSKGDTVPGSARQWQAFGRLLSTPRVATTLDQ
jgi:hypothetical protein